MAKHAKSVFAQDVEGLISADLPLHLRVQGRIRATILNGSFAPGSRLPSSRLLACDFKVSRHTVEWALSDLEAEGFIERKRGSGTYVATAIPLRELVPSGALALPIESCAHEPSRRGNAISIYATQAEPVVARAFHSSSPALDLFPKRIWSRLVRRALSRRDIDPWGYGASAGLKELRRAVAEHVAVTRGIRCVAEQIIVVTSIQQAIDLAARVLCDVGDDAWFEEPGYPIGRYLLRSAGLNVVPIPIDADGFDPERALQTAPHAKLAYVTPSHQYPTGALMPLDRRLALLEWARTRGGWILEDDYDGDFRYEGRSPAALQALDPGGRVIYIGTFTKMMFPALRLSYMVVPEELVSIFDTMKHLADGFTTLHTQVALAEFIDGGHLAAHLRHMLREYDTRRLALIEAIAPLAGLLELGPASAGFHVTAYLKGDQDDRAVAQACARRGVDLHPLSPFYVNKPRPGLLFGFACACPEQIARGMTIVRESLG